MSDYFTSEHFAPLKKWQGQKRDESNVEQNRAYDELKKAYSITERWAQDIKQRLAGMSCLSISASLWRLTSVLMRSSGLL